MSLETTLFRQIDGASPVPRGLPLVIAMTGFTDAGSTAEQFITYIREHLDTEPVVVYDNDRLLDYRARRPVMTFDGSQLSDLSSPRLEISMVYDAQGQPFLALLGYEPDFAWEAFARSVQQIIRMFEISTVTWVHAIGMPVPHTRPLGATVSGNRQDLAEAHSVWKPHTQLPGTAPHLLEYRLVEHHIPVSGFAILIPYYLGDTEYPAAAIAALDSVTAATELTFSVEHIQEQNVAFLEKVGEQIASNDELNRMLAEFEERYDAYMSDSTTASPLIHQGDLPSADELAAELERFLGRRSTER